MDPMLLILIAGGLIAITAVILGVLKRRIAATVLAAIAAVITLGLSAVIWSLSHGTALVGAVIGSGGAAVSLLAIALAWRAKTKPVPAAADAPFSVLAVVGFVLAFLVAIAGLVVSYLALRETRPGTRRGYPLAAAGVVLSWASIILTVFLYPILIQTVLYNAGIIRW